MTNIKFELIRELYRQGYDKKGIRSFFDFIDLIIRLPDDLEKKLFEEITKIEEDYKMPHVTTWERTAEKRGIKIGKKEQKIEIAKELMKNGIDTNIIAKSTGISREELEKLATDDH